MSLRQRYLQLALISLAGGAIYPLVYLRQNFELSLLEALGISAAELQSCYALLGTLFVVTYLPSGWLADRFRSGGDPSMEPYARLKGRLRYKAADSALHLQVRQPHAFRAIPHLDPALQARLSSALQRPDRKPQTRAKIEKILKPNESQPSRGHQEAT